MQLSTALDRLKEAFKRAGSQLGGGIIKHGDMPLERLDDGKAASPLMDAFENDAEYLFRFDVPGATEKNAEVHFTEGRTLSVYVKSVADKKDLKATETGFNTDWSRTVRLPDSADTDRATSSVRNGVLTVRVPKAATPAPKRITVKTE